MSEEDVYEAFDSVETNYISLIQQYLSLFLVENATFLAERMVAYRPSMQAVYLLGICYYRSGSPQRTRSILLHESKEAFAFISNPSSTTSVNKIDDKSNNNNHRHLESTQQEVLCNSILYHLATCCYDLGFFIEAEDHLLRGCMQRFAAVQVQKYVGNYTSKNRSSDMDEWMVQAYPSPIPNGSAGLHLLGKISLKRGRFKRAERYFRMSLKVYKIL